MYIYMTSTSIYLHLQWSESVRIMEREVWNKIPPYRVFNIMKKITDHLNQ